MEKGFLGSLFDLSFTSFVTPKVIKVLYVLTLVMLVLGYFWIAVGIFSSNDEPARSVTFGSEFSVEEDDDNSHIFLGLLWLFVLGPLMLVLYTLLYRVIYELMMVVFRLYETNRDQLALTRLIHPDAATEFDAARVAAATPVGPPPGYQGQQGWQQPQQQYPPSGQQKWQQPPADYPPPPPAQGSDETEATQPRDGDPPAK